MSLDLFHPLIREWFLGRFGEPTEVQRRAWPAIASGRHVLMTAPTGSGKTLAAFLWALDRLATGAWEGGRLRVLYVSPLKALNSDIERNLQGPLAELAELFRSRGVDWPAIRVATRSGDTPPAERQRMVRRPPEILVTTPESLNLLLTSKNARGMFAGLATVILDEIHAVAGTRRGTHLVTAVERLVPLAGELQRLALSATVRPLAVVADLVAGFERRGTGADAMYHRRAVEVLEAPGEKRYDLEVRSLFGGDEEPSPEEMWPRLAAELVREIESHRSTLVFTNSRRHAEKVTRLVNAAAGADLVYAHHGSLAREIRTEVEHRLKEGKLAAIVATSSLELGIDVGALDSVLLVQTPRSLAAAIQRVGRAGHGVGEVSRGLFLPLFGRDLLDAAVAVEGIRAQRVEELRPISAPLDVLAQVVLSMLAVETWPVEELYGFLRCAAPYHELPRRHFDLVLEMLAGRFADARLAELQPRISIDRLAGTAHARPGAARLVYQSGGTIPDRGYFHLRVEGSRALLGELDEEFVWERQVGDTFLLGAQVWRIREITHDDVLVTPAPGVGMTQAPFWRAEERDRDFFFSAALLDFLERAEPRLGDPALAAELTTRHGFTPAAAAALLRYLRLQVAATGALPHRRQLLVEHTEAAGEKGGASGERVILHTFWGGKVNRPLALALAAIWEEESATPLEIAQDDDCLMLRLPEGSDVRALLSRLDPLRLEELLRRRLEASGFFGARFREAAGRALLLPRAGFRSRTPLWLSRQRAKELLAAVARYGDFPIVLETWRACLAEELDLASLRRLLGELADGAIRIVEARTSRPSPFADHLMWRHTNALMYEDDVPLAGRGGALAPSLLRELVFAAQLRPRLPAELIERFRQRLQRTAPGWAPGNAEELLDWTRERLWLPAGEWDELLAAIERDDGTSPLPRLAELAATLARARLPGASEEGVVALESLPRLLAAFGTPLAEVALAPIVGRGVYEAAADWERTARGVVQRLAEEDADRRDDEAPRATLADWLEEWLRHAGPIGQPRLTAIFGGPVERLDDAVADLAEEERLVIDVLRGVGDEPELCHPANLEALLRALRAEARPEIEARPATELPLFLALQQGLWPRGATIGDLQARLERLLGFPAPAAAWESDLLPARLAPYYPSWLDSLMQESSLRWLGCGRERITFCFEEDVALLRDASGVGELGEEAPRAAEPNEEAAEGDSPGVAEVRLEAVPSAEADLASVARQATVAAAGMDALRTRLAVGGRHELAELARATGVPTALLGSHLWRLAWAGEAVNDTFLAMRRGIESGFQAVAIEAPAAVGAAPRARRRGAFQRWQGSRPFPGRWSAPPAADEGELEDPLAREELRKDRARLLLDRYGVLFRELLARELPGLQWRQVARALRLLELGGEIVAGHFFAGVRGLQFASKEAFRRLRDGLPPEAIWWVSALDPASLCGVEIEGLSGLLPRRQPGTHLVFHGATLVLVSRRGGRELEVHVPADHPSLGDYLDLFRTRLTRQFHPEKAIDIERVNGEPAAQSPYSDALTRRLSATRDGDRLRLRRAY